MFGKLNKRMEEERSETTIEAEMETIKKEFPSHYEEVVKYVNEMKLVQKKHNTLYPDTTILSNVIFQKKELRKFGKTKIDVIK